MHENCFQAENSPLPMPIKIDHLRFKPGSQNRPVLPDLSQPPPGLVGSQAYSDVAAGSRNFLSTPTGSQASNRSLLPTPHGGQGSNKVLLPNPPPGLPPNFARFIDTSFIPVVTLLLVAALITRLCLLYCMLAVDVLKNTLMQLKKSIFAVSEFCDL